MKKLFLLAAVIAIAFAAQTASAGIVGTIENAGFESYSGGDPTWQNPVDSWSFASNEAGHAASRGETWGNYPSSVPEGNLYLNIYKNTWIWQQIGDVACGLPYCSRLKSGGVYTVSYDVSDANSDVNTWVSVAIYAGDTWGAGTNQIVPMLYLKATDTDAVLDDKEFHTYSVSYDTTDPCNTAFVAENLGEPLWVRITAGPYGANPAAWFYVDNFQMSYVSDTEQILTIQVDPCDVDTLTPSVGEHTVESGFVDVNAAVPYVACPDVYRFDHWEGDVTDPCSAATTVFMDASKTITAVFTVATRECGDECHPNDLVGDYNHDCIIDFNDFSDFALNWSVCTKPECD